MNNGQSSGLFSSGMYGQHQGAKPAQGMYHQPYGGPGMYSSQQQAAPQYGEMVNRNMPIKVVPGTPSSSAEAYSRTPARDDQGSSIYILSICGRQTYKDYSQEEIRAADYIQGSKGEIVSSGGGYNQSFMQNMGGYLGNQPSFGSMGQSSTFYGQKQEAGGFGQNKYGVGTQASSGFGQNSTSEYGAAQNKGYGGFESTGYRAGAGGSSSSVFGGDNRLGSTPSTFSTMSGGIQQSSMQQQNMAQPSPHSGQSIGIFRGQGTPIHANTSFGQQSGDMGAGYGARPFDNMGPSQIGMGGLGSAQTSTPQSTAPSTGFGVGHQGAGSTLGGQQQNMTSTLFGQQTGQLQGAPQGQAHTPGLGTAYRPLETQPSIGFGQTQSPAPSVLGNSFLSQSATPGVSPSPFGGGSMQPGSSSAAGSPFSSTPSMGGYQAQSPGQTQPSTANGPVGLLGGPSTASGMFSSAGSMPQAQTSLQGGNPLLFSGKPADSMGQESKPGLFSGFSTPQTSGIAGTPGMGMSGTDNTMGLSSAQSGSTSLVSMGTGASTGMGSVMGMGAGSSSTGLGGGVRTTFGGGGILSAPAGTTGSNALGAGHTMGAGLSSGLAQSADSGYNKFGLFSNSRPDQTISTIDPGLSSAPPGHASFSSGKYGHPNFGSSISSFMGKSEKANDPYLLSELNFKECDEYARKKRLDVPKILFEKPAKSTIKFKPTIAFKSGIAATKPFKPIDFGLKDEQEYEKNQYYTVPSIEKLKTMRGRKVSGLIVGKKGAGSIEYKCDIDLSEVNLDTLAQDVQFVDGSVRMYPTKDVEVGVGLNNPSRVVLENVFAYSKSTGFRIQGKRETSPYKEMQEQILRSATEGKGAKLISYDYDTGRLIMDVDHF